MSETYSNLHWVVVATQIDKPCFNYFSYTSDAGRVCKVSYDDLRTEFKKRWDDGQKIGVLGATTDTWYMTFVRGGLRRGGGQTVRTFSTYDQLVKGWEEDRGLISQVASRAGMIIALFEPLHSGEQAGLFSVKGGKLEAKDLQDARDRSSRNIIAATFFEKENRWIFVLSSFESCSEKWRVDDTLNRAFIKENLDDGYLLRSIVASPTQWFVLMQKNATSPSIRQTIHLTQSSTSEFETQKWKENYQITSATGNTRYREPQSNAVALRGSGAMAAAGRPTSAASVRLQQYGMRQTADGLALYFSSLDIAIVE